MFGMSVSASAFDVPANDGFYTQTTPLLALAQEADIERILEEYERSTSNQIAILVIESLEGEAPEDIALSVGRAWGVGAQGKDNGILIL
ncbi:MAG: TPM domain-containing protein, partial [Candidatus Peribacteraceae bacterium]|nr:TPM domain-containing protein [Candidatus Peribacteraceae bacterium]